MPWQDKEFHWKKGSGKYIDIKTEMPVEYAKNCVKFCERKYAEYRKKDSTITFVQWLEREIKCWPTLAWKAARSNSFPPSGEVIAERKYPEPEKIQYNVELLD